LIDPKKKERAKDAIARRDPSIFRRQRPLLRSEKERLNNQLFNAVRNGNLEKVRHFLDIGVEVDSIERDSGWTALMSAASCGRKEVVELLIDRGAKIDACDDYGVTVLMKATSQCCTETVIVLINKGANVNAKDLQGWTALRWANHHGDTESAEILRKAGAID